MQVKAEAPGRVNIIGEHTDYNQGWVMPVAIDLSLEVDLTLRTDRNFIATAEGFDQGLSFHLDQLKPVNNDPCWLDYIKGVCWALQKKGYFLSGAEISIKSQIPTGAGLSSSAALELAVAGALNKASNLKIDQVNLALICQQAENEYVGVKCGIMDQFAVALALKNQALLVDCLSLVYSYIPFDLGDYRLLIVDSRVKRSLMQSAYNRRREECKEAVVLIGKTLGRDITSLRSVSLNEIKRIQDYLPDLLYRRSRYVIEENSRVLGAVKALEKGDLVSLGYFLNRSHAGLRDYYEVSCPELDLIVDTAREDKSVTGARMTGAGFGGCAIILLHEIGIDCVCNRINDAFLQNGWANPHYYITTAADGLVVRLLS
jgi:galactokinase